MMYCSYKMQAVYLGRVRAAVKKNYEKIQVFYYNFRNCGNVYLANSAGS